MSWLAGLLVAIGGDILFRLCDDKWFTGFEFITIICLYAIFLELLMIRQKL